MRQQSTMVPAPMLLHGPQHHVVTAAQVAPKVRQHPAGDVMLHPLPSLRCCHSLLLLLPLQAEPVQHQLWTEAPLEEKPPATLMRQQVVAREHAGTHGEARAQPHRHQMQLPRALGH